VTIGESKGGMSIHGTNFRGVISAKNILNVKTQTAKTESERSPVLLQKRKAESFYWHARGEKTATSFT